LSISPYFSGKPVFFPGLVFLPLARLFGRTFLPRFLIRLSCFPLRAERNAYENPPPFVNGPLFHSVDSAPLVRNFSGSILFGVGPRLCTLPLLPPPSFELEAWTRLWFLQGGVSFWTFFSFPLIARGFARNRLAPSFFFFFVISHCNLFVLCNLPFCSLRLPILAAVLLSYRSSLVVVTPVPCLSVITAGVSKKIDLLSRNFRTSGASRRAVVFYTPTALTEHFFLRKM